MDGLDYICKSKDEVSFFVDLFGSKEGNFNVRTNIFGVNEFEPFLKSITTRAKVNFVVCHSTKPNLKRYLWSKTYLCHHAGQSVKKNMGCKLRLRVRIKKLTWSTRYKDHHIESFPCLISVIGSHSHNMLVLNTLRTLPVLSPTKRIMEHHFRSGMGPSEAKSEMAKQLTVTERADTSIFPKPNFFYKYYNNYATSINGDLGGHKMNEAIQQLKIEFPECTFVFQPKKEQQQMSLCIMTPLMKRVIRSVPQAAELVFMDTTSHVDLQNNNVTLLLTWSPAGGLPIGVLITESQLEESYFNGLMQWKSAIGRNAFYGREEPQLFMTDDSQAERNALSEAFKTSIALLCQFHVLQAMWRWLWDSTHNIVKNDRKHLMGLFRGLVTARTEELLSSAVQSLNLDSIAVSYPGFLKHVSDVMTKVKDWATCHRRFLPTRGHNTNNFAEAGMRILKEHVLQRKKAFNTTELARHVVTTFEEQIQNRMLDIAYQRAQAKHNPKNTGTVINPENVEKDSESGLFFVQSSSPESDHAYLVDAEMKICSCPIGSLGTICKHIVAVATHYPLDIQLDKIASAEERYLLAQIAVGTENVPNREFFGLMDLEQSTPKAVLLMNPNQSCNSEQMQVDTVQENTSVSTPTAESMENEVDSLLRIFKEVASRHGDSDAVVSGLKTMSKTLSKLQNVNSNTFATSLFNFGKEALGSIRCSKRGQMIPVQPTSRSRRSEGQSRGGRALYKGRPRKALNKTTKKRSHCLAKSISMNVPNGKAH